ncbi:aminoglycoside phosphotransferase [Mycobacteroides abscessus]|uniref:Possible phosphotransferase n=3 Tax=Mycobacteroides abscessus TaxID=36809 RepID=B1MMC0_MYCA9|nr:aminoglycoside phosphotransferase [Mycobacteroides abscessus]RTZ47260.1 aminoglycoside phosphotransferase family protein [Mycobacteroides abscessus subsp. abscessus]CAM64905.1 Possible phosphotransferase [Mycobacteroides abscessus ATCC 19977]OTR24268.1 aminoglycoside phosphotransferase [Mycobacteroides abscessus]PVA31965.1 aminoglycoside phosphotransferase [Mycobacteroides abscessus]
MLRAVDMHAGQVRITSSVVRGLIDAQFPQWRVQPIRPVQSVGTVNAIFRIGSQFAARFPLQGEDPGAVLQQLQAESDAAAKLVGRTRFPTPEPVAIGSPGPGYGLPWSVQTWLPGVVATGRDPGDSAGFARDLAEFVAGVRMISTGGKNFEGPGRGGVIALHDEWMQMCFERSAGLLDVPRLRQVWAQMRELPRGSDVDVTSHRDLIPGNMLVSGEGRLAGVLDAGGLGPADPALDLVGAWHLLDAAARKVFRESLRPDELQWQRGRAWAFQQAMGLVWYYANSNPAMSRVGRRTLDRLLADSS